MAGTTTTPPGSSTLTIGNIAGVSNGSYDIEITGSSTTDPLSTTVKLDLYETSPTAATLLTPNDGSNQVDYKPIFEWGEVPLVSSYYLEIASDIEFTDIVYTATATITSHITTMPLKPLTDYYWRVSTQNVCGRGTSTPFSFTTKSPTLTCNGPAVTFETGLPGDWEVVDNSLSGAGIVWTTTADPACEISNLTNGSGEAACADSDAADFVSPAYNTEMILNPFDLSAYTSVVMDVKAYYLDYETDANDHFEIDVWDGSSWMNELSWDEDGHNPEDINLDLSAYAGLSTIQARFRYYGDSSDGYAQVDDISLSCAAPAVSIEPSVLATTQQPSMKTTLPLTITNKGHADLIWEILEGDCGSPTEHSWLSISPTSGAITSDGDASVDVNVDSTGLTPDTYFGNLCVTSNDPMTPSLSIPVELTVEPITIDITKMVKPSSVFEPGDELDITILVTNTSLINLTIQSLIDSDFDLNTNCPDAVGSILMPGESYACAFKAFFASNANQQHVGMVTVTANDGSINTVTNSATAQLAIQNTAPSISVARHASRFYAHPGDTVKFTTVLTNNSVDTDPVTIYALMDDIFGDITHSHDDISATDCVTGITIQPGDSQTCSFTAKIPANCDETLTTPLTVSGSDDEESQTQVYADLTFILDYSSLYLPIVSR